MNYTVITKEIAEYKSNGKLSDIYTFSCIRSTIDYKSGISKISQIKLSEKFNIPERSMRDAIIRLETQRLISVERKIEEKGKNSLIKKNYYHFNLNPKNYFFVNNEFLTMNLPNEIKGFLLLLKSVCLNNTNYYKSSKAIKNCINKSELSKSINMDKKTIEKYLKLSQQLKQIEIINNTIMIINNYFPLKVDETKKSLDNRKTEIRNTIFDLCKYYNANMPLISEKEIERIRLFYPLDERTIENTNDNDFIKNNSIKYKLSNRIKSLPKEFNIEYLLKVLNIPIMQEEKKEKYTFILD